MTSKLKIIRTTGKFDIRFNWSIDYLIWVFVDYSIIFQNKLHPIPIRLVEILEICTAICNTSTFPLLILVHYIFESVI